MTKIEAKKLLNTGYIILISGVVTGLLFHQQVEGSTLFSSSLMFGYIFWSIYWGYKTIYKKLNFMYNSPVHIKAKNNSDYFLKNTAFKLASEFVKFWICYFVGVLGGSIYQQIRLSKIAYF